jgi:hypothetical protein
MGKLLQMENFNEKQNSFSNVDREFNDSNKENILIEKIGIDLISAMKNPGGPDDLFLISSSQLSFSISHQDQEYNDR